MCSREGEKGGVTSKRGELLVELRSIASASGHVSREAVAVLAASLEVPVSEVFGVASFYSFLSTRPRGRNVIRVCRSLPCTMKNGLAVVEAIQETIGVPPGESTPDGRYAFELTNCIGGCDEAPAMLVNDDFHGSLSREKVRRILKGYA